MSVTSAFIKMIMKVSVRNAQNMSLRLPLGRKQVSVAEGDKSYHLAIFLFC